MKLSEWGIPPIEKIHEAYSAVADDRVKMFEDHALVNSSDFKKQYIIEWKENTYSSNDNASYYQGYIGYPVIAVLLLQGKISFSPIIADYFKGINWKALNTQYKNKYSKVVELIMTNLAEKGIDIQLINGDIASIYEQLKTMDLEYKRSKHVPPK